MIPALGAGGPGFKSRLSPVTSFHSIRPHILFSFCSHLEDLTELSYEAED